jgi:hypothetical protein
MEKAGASRQVISWWSLSLGELNIVLCKGVVAEWNNGMGNMLLKRYRQVQVHTILTKYGTALVQAG